MGSYICHTVFIVIRIFWRRLYFDLGILILKYSRQMKNESEKNIHIIVWVRLVVFNASFNNISVIPWRSVLLVEET
jgi:hypothetical protein